MDELRNKVAESGLITLDLEDFIPKKGFVLFDLKNFLYMELILKEKEFRVMLDEHQWDQYQNKWVAIICSADAIIPMWAYMLVVSKLITVTTDIYVGDEPSAQKNAIIEKIIKFNAEDYRDKRVVVKGCGDKEIAEYAYVEISKKLIPVVKSLMYGEPCSTVPVFKNKKQQEG
jgi:hypothetical protein